MFDILTLCVRYILYAHARYISAFYRPGSDRAAMATAAVAYTLKVLSHRLRCVAASGVKEP